MQHIEMRFRTRAKIIETKEGEALGFGFRFGPISIYAIANMPEDDGNEDGPLVYVKLDLRETEDWKKWTIEK